LGLSITCTVYSASVAVTFKLAIDRPSSAGSVGGQGLGCTSGAVEVRLLYSTKIHVVELGMLLGHMLAIVVAFAVVTAAVFGFWAAVIWLLRRLHQRL
jgi:hypothetical protein